MSERKQQAPSVPVIEIREPEVTERVVPARGDRPSFTVRTQVGRIQLPGEPETRPVQIPVEQEGYKPGRYVPSGSSYYVGSYDRLALGRLILEPAPH